MSVPQLTTDFARTAISKSAEFAKKKAPGTIGAKQTLTTNLSKIEVVGQQVFFKYDVVVEAVFRKENGDLVATEVTKPSKKDHTSQNRRICCVRVYKEILNKNAKEFESATTYYDRSKVLFSMKKLNIGDKKTFEVKLQQVSGFEDAEMFKFSIKPCGESFQTTSSDLVRAVNSRPSLQDKTFLEVISLATSKQPLESLDQFVSYGTVHYLYDPSVLGFNLPDIPDGKYMGAGASKKVSVLEGEKKEPTAYVTTEVKKTNFHNDNQSLMEKMKLYNFGSNPMQWGFKMREFGRLLKDVDVYSQFLPKRIHSLAGFSEQNSKTVVFAQRDGKMITVFDYFKKQYKKTLQYPDLFLAVCYRGKDPIYFPIEVLFIAPNQRVIQGQATGKETQISIRASAMLPADRLRHTKDMKTALGLTPDNANLKKAGIKIDKDFADVPSRVLPAPVVFYGGNKVLQNLTDNVKWNNATGGNINRYIMPATLNSWAVIGMFASGDDVNIKRFAQVYANEMKRRGMAVVSEAKVQTIQPSEHSIDAVFKTAEVEKTQMLMFVSSESIKLHDYIKNAEVKKQILTQEFLSRSVGNMISQRGSPQTIEDCVNKTNCKLGGLNYMVGASLGAMAGKVPDWLRKDSRTLFFGLEMTHPAALTKSEEIREVGYSRPSVLGYACNVGMNPQQFLGDYLFVEPRSTEPMGSSIAAILPKCVKEARAARNIVADHLVFYFHGVSEGQYGEVASTYLDYIRRGCLAIHESYKPATTILCVSKEHNERLFNKHIAGEKAAMQNIKPGTVVDTVIVNPVVTEFYLNSHSAFQGTAKPAKYTVVHDSTNSSLDAVEAATEALCFLAEIVTAAVSVPAPLLVADRCAKRGAKVYAAQTSSDVNVAHMNLAQLNEQLTNSGKLLGKVRYNA